MSSKIELLSVYPDPDCEKCQGKGGTFDERDAFHRCDCSDHMLHGRRVNRAGIGEEFYGKTLAAYSATSETQVYGFQQLSVWVSTFNENSKWLFMYGSTGSGKTHLACALLVALSKLYGKTIKFLAVQDFLHDAKAFGSRDDRGITYADKAFDIAADVDVLALDDLGAEQLTEFAADRLYALIDSRYRDRAITIFTSNLARTGLEARYDPRMVDRMLGRSLVLEINGESRIEASRAKMVHV